MQVENQTGLDLVCRFDHGKAKQDGVVQSWDTNAFLIRYITGWGRSLESMRTYHYEVQLGSVCHSCHNAALYLLQNLVINRVILKLNMTCGWELVVLHTTPSMFGMLLVHGWMEGGGANGVHFISVH